MACNKALSTVACSFQFTNIADEDLYLLKRNTPLEGFYSPFLTLSIEGRPVQYKGILASRIAPTKDEFILLKAGESIAASVQITDVFNIDTDGLYTVQYSKPLQYLSVDEMSVMSNGEVRESTVHESAYIYLDNTHLLLKPTKPEEPKIEYTVHIEACGSASFTNGDHKNNETLEAHKKLCAGIDKAKSKVGNTAEYRTWFGTYTTARANAVKTVYQKMRDNISSKTVTYYNYGPQCQSNWYAYTYIGSGTTVYLCKIFYSYKIPCIGDGYTKESSLAHEWSHTFGSTRDHAYHVSGCQSLAIRSPDLAVANADSFRFFYCRNQ